MKSDSKDRFSFYTKLEKIKKVRILNFVLKLYFFYLKINQGMSSKITIIFR